MNSDPEPAAEPPCASPEPETCNLEPATVTLTHRANGKIARLPKPLRDQINHWLVDGLSYATLFRLRKVVVLPLQPPFSRIQRISRLLLSSLWFQLRHAVYLRSLLFNLQPSIAPVTISR